MNATEKDAALARRLGQQGITITRHPFRLTTASARGLAALYRAWCWYSPLRPIAERRALSRILEDI